MGSFAEYWPEYPPAGNHSTLVLVDADKCAVDDLFILIFGCNSPFQERAREARGYTAFSESEWVLDENELPSLPGGFGWTLPAPSNSHQLRGAYYQTRMRKICFQQSGQSLRTEELHRCNRAAQGSDYIVDCTVAVTAPFGDCFRAVCRYSLVATGPESCQLRIDYAMAYAKRMSGIARAMLEPAAESGLAKNFAQFMAVLSDHVSLADATEAAPSLSSPVPQGIDAQGIQTVTSTPVPAAKKGDTMAQSAAESVTALLTVAGSQRRVRSVVTVFVDDHLLDFFLPAAEVLLMSVGISTSTQNVAVRGCATLLSTAFVLVLIQQLLNLWHNGGEWCEMHSSWILARMCVTTHNAVDLPRSVTGIVVAAVAIMLVRSILGDWAGQMTDRQRVRLSEGDEGADAEAPSDNSSRGTAAQVPERQSSATEQPNVHVQRLQAIGNFLIFRWDRLGGPQQQQQHTADASVALDRGAEASAASTSNGASRAPSNRDKAAAPKKAAVSVGSMSLSKSNSGLLSNSGKQPSVVTSVRVGSPHQSCELPGKLNVTALRSHPAAGVAATLDASPRTPDRHTAQLGRTNVPVRSSTAGLPASPAGTAAIPEQKQQPQGPVHRPAGGMVVEEVFENERWQPFRGWGHTWPGHFLPTDHVRHWCNANAQAQEGGHRHRGMEFEDAAPPLPAEWIWVDEWKVDLSGRPYLSCDPHGWHYAFNFSLLLFRGRTHALHPLPCVRRRRWIRTRVLEAWGPVTADMQLHLVPSRRAVCPTRLGSSSNSSTPRSNSPDVGHGETGIDAMALRRIGSDSGHNYRRHVGVDAKNSQQHSAMLAAGHGASQSTSVSGLPSPEPVVNADESQLSGHSVVRIHSLASELRTRVSSGDTEMVELGAESSDRLRGGEEFGSGDIDALLSARRRTASTPAGILCRGQGVSGDTSPESKASPSLTVPCLSLGNLMAPRRGSTQGSTQGSSSVPVKARSWNVPSEAEAERTSGDLLKIYSERLYGGSSS